jgi:hypothetical protein
LNGSSSSWPSEPPCAWSQKPNPLSLSLSALKKERVISA